jgi:hypothetical protein
MFSRNMYYTFPSLARHRLWERRGAGTNNMNEIICTRSNFVGHSRFIEGLCFDSLYAVLFVCGTCIM